MKNVFQKCLRRDFGEYEYLLYVQMCREELRGQTPEKMSYENKPIYQHMYQLLKQETPESLTDRAERLLDTMHHAFQIGRQFFSVIIFYILSNIVLIGLELDYTVTCISLSLIGACFLYKLVEFLTNKYCFIDAYLVMVYKAVLEKLQPPALY
ncbi:MAG: hypothetical protein J1E62_01240 [Lachnospiraceae bacterium]|nr:hypothetical protein [Lachnospiraceae bacterium]